MKKILKASICIVLLAFVVIIASTVNAAGTSASIKASSTSVTVGTKVTITSTVTGATWNLKTSGGGISGNEIGYTDKASNVTKSYTYSLNTSKAGTYTVYLTGNVEDYDTELSSSISKSVTVTVKAITTTNRTTNTTTAKPATNTTTTTKSSNANIFKLKLSEEGLSPAFSKSQTAYSLNVGENVDKIQASVTLENSKAVYTVSGNKDLKNGKNVMKIVVTAENGTTKTYTINIVKASNAEDADASLVNLIVEDVDFPFDKNVTEYNLGKIKQSDKLNIFAYPTNEEAKFEIIGNEGLKEGENKVVVRVTSQDGSVTQDYTLTFTMVDSESDLLMTVSPYAEVNNTKPKNSTWPQIVKILKQNATIILLYLLALVEFAQVVYLYVQLKAVDPDRLKVKIGRRSRNAKYNPEDK